MIKREKYLKNIRGFYDQDLIKVITGIRRSGKSTLLKQIIDDIDAGNSNISYEEQCKILHFIQNMTDKDQRMSKIQACDYLGISRATFDNYVKNGWIPKGYKQDGFKELSWMKSDLDFYLDTYSNNK